MNIKYFSLPIALVMTGCMPAYNYTQQNFQSTVISFPEVGKISTAMVGDDMLGQGIIVEKEVLFVPNDIDITKYLIIKAGNYEKLGVDGNKQTFIGNNSYLPNGGMILRRGNIESLYGISFNSKNNKICVTSPIGAPHCRENFSANVKKVKTVGKDAFQQTLIYSGKIGNKINIDYRESSSNIVNPTFGTRIEYDLSESKEIGYKGALLKIIEANNQNIKYQVIKNFNN